MGSNIVYWHGYIDTESHILYDIINHGLSQYINHIAFWVYFFGAIYTLNGLLSSMTRRHAWRGRVQTVYPVSFLKLYLSTIRILEFRNWIASTLNEAHTIAHSCTFFQTYTHMRTTRWRMGKLNHINLRRDQPLTTNFWLMWSTIC